MTTTPRKTTRKAAPKTTAKVTGAEVIVKSEEELLKEEQSVIEQEVATETEDTGGKETPTFTIQLNGEDIEVEDRWNRPGKIPPISVMFSSDEMAAKMSTPIIVQLIGEDQLYNLIMLGLTQDEFVLVARAWMESRGLGK